MDTDKQTDKKPAKRAKPVPPQVATDEVQVLRQADAGPIRARHHGALSHGGEPSLCLRLPRLQGGAESGAGFPLPPTVRSIPPSAVLPPAVAEPQLVPPAAAEAPGLPPGQGLFVGRCATRGGASPCPLRPLRPRPIRRQRCQGAPSRIFPTLQNQRVRGRLKFFEKRTCVFGGDVV